MDMSTAKKLVYKWMGPYHVCNAIPEKGMYELEEFDGTPVPGMHPGNQLKKFVKREGFYIPVDMEEEEGSEAEEGDAVMSDVNGDISEATLQPETFKIVLPQLTVEQQREYAQYEEDDKGNIL